MELSASILIASLQFLLYGVFNHQKENVSNKEGFRNCLVFGCLKKEKEPSTCIAVNENCHHFFFFPPFADVKHCNNAKSL